jgi:hypothetical protein
MISTQAWVGGRVVQKFLLEEEALMSIVVRCAREQCLPSGGRALRFPYLP